MNAGLLCLASLPGGNLVAVNFVN
uniref:Uncharacterized protein n=1 Tax=Anguilla anguilla TaxID=7936 RepID=A0A0E9PA82_ANGAN